MAKPDLLKLEIHHWVVALAEGWTAQQAEDRMDALRKATRTLVRQNQANQPQWISLRFGEGIRRSGVGSISSASTCTTTLLPVPLIRMFASRGASWWPKARHVLDGITSLGSVLSTNSLSK